MILYHDSNYPPHPGSSTSTSLYTQFLECSGITLDGSLLSVALKDLDIVFVIVKYFNDLNSSSNCTVHYWITPLNCFGSENVIPAMSSWYAALYPGPLTSN